mmetsp:Transcript_21144/g.43665  ORF Transcript_21144/g.43665 Transcript_21144/m.43665 type:complete len:539 (-) Transcript_21144:77-1693(-)
MAMLERLRSQFAFRLFISTMILGTILVMTLSDLRIENLDLSFKSFDRSNDERLEPIQFDPALNHSSFLNVSENLGYNKMHDGVNTSQSIRNFNQNYNPEEYTFLIIHYHKTGHVISRKMYDLIGKGSTSRKIFGVPYKYKREHDKETKCPKFGRIFPGMVSVVTAPNLFCPSEKIRQILMQSRSNTTRARIIRGTPRLHRGFKIIHMVRNPYDMAISNYFYHSQVPSPEKWVHWAKPCTYKYYANSSGLRLHRGKNISNLPDENDSVKSLILPTLTEISSQQFDKAYMLCRSIFRNETNTNFFGENAIISPNKPTFYDHLHNLDTNDGLRLATAQMIISSGVEFEEEKMSERDAIDESTRQKIYEKRVRSGPKVTRIPTRRQHNIIRSFEDKDVKAFLNTRSGPGRSAGADIIRMGNNIRKLNELVVGNNVESEKPSDNIQVLTMDMTHWISNPFDSAIKVVDFVYGNSISSLEKRKLAIKYQESFNEKVADNSQHITTGKSYSREDKAALVEMLKGDEALGPILDEVEKLVNETMAK